MNVSCALCETILNIVIYRRHYDNKICNQSENVYIDGRHLLQAYTQ